jgi:site-specific DNA recombinase
MELVKKPSPVEIPICLKIRGGETLIVPPNGPSNHPHQDATLIKALGRAWNWRRALERGSVRSVVEFARASGCTVRYVTRLLKIAYLAPDIIEAILGGRQPRELTLAQLFRTDIPLDWQAQRQALGF